MKPRNIFIKNDIWKIGDFGIARKLLNKDETRTSMVGTPVYMSPEMFYSEPYTMKTDIWAFGVIAYYIFHGKRPFSY